jgi:hypothetical protein
MAELEALLRDRDIFLLPLFGELWGLKNASKNHDELITQVAAAMRDSARVVAMWQGLTEEMRGTLQLLASSPRRRQPKPMFERLHGPIRKLGKTEIDKEKPHLQNKNKAEALFYRGLISEVRDRNQQGNIVSYVVLPEDLANLLPLQDTSYAKLVKSTTSEFVQGGGMQQVAHKLEPLDESDIEQPQPAATSLVDDLTTLLAFLRIHSPEVGRTSLAPAAQEKLRPYLLNADESRLAFLMIIGVAAELIEVQDGRALAGKTAVQPWLNATRAVQLKTLAEAWRSANLYAEVWHTPGLEVESAAYDAPVARKVVFDLMRELTPANGWWSLSDFVEMVKIKQPDFQRPDGNYDNWYLRGEDGAYLKGFESWDSVEGAVLEFMLQGPMHWLGLADIADDAIRLSVYGKAFLHNADWPQPAVSAESIEIRPDGTLLASRKVKCSERYQLARFTSWLPGTDKYGYRLDGPGLQQAAAQGILPPQVITFLKRHFENKPLPPKIISFVEGWQGGGGPTGEVTFEQLLVLRTVSSDVLDKVYDTPATRRYLLGRLGPTAGVIDPTQSEALKAALAELGLQVEIR